MEHKNKLKNNSTKIKSMIKDLKTILDTLENNSHQTCDKFSKDHRIELVQIAFNLNSLINRESYLDNLRTFANEIIGVGFPNVEREVA